MKLRNAIVTLVILALAIPVQVLAQGSKAEQEVRVTLDQFTQINQKGGAEAATMMDKLLADDYTQVIGNGTVFTKAETVNGWRTGRFRAWVDDVSDVKVRIYGKTAVATGMFKGRAPQGQPMRSRFTRVLVKRGGNWQCVSMQYTTIAEPAKQ
jgi:hypothetical protein